MLFPRASVSFTILPRASTSLVNLLPTASVKLVFSALIPLPSLSVGCTEALVKLQNAMCAGQATEKQYYFMINQ